MPGREEVPGVERFALTPADEFGPSMPVAMSDGDWVRYSDYEKLEAALDKRGYELSMMDYERAKEADRADQARNQERQRIEEEVKGNDGDRWFVSVLPNGQIDRNWPANCEGRETPQERLMGDGARIAAVVPEARLREERQRIQEALLSDKAIWAAGARLPGSEHDTAEDWAKEAIEAALDTLDPSGEPKTGRLARQVDRASAAVRQRPSYPHPSGEQGEEKETRLGWSLIHQAHAERREVRVKLSLGRDSMSGPVVAIADAFFDMDLDGFRYRVLWAELDQVEILPATDTSKEEREALKLIAEAAPDDDPLACLNACISIAKKALP